MSVDPTPLALVRSAREFAHAAQVVMEKQNIPNGGFSAPAYYLACHSIELSLKGSLLLAGTSLQRLRSDFGHGLAALLSEAELQGATIAGDLSEAERDVILALDELHQSHRLRYFRPGEFVVPSPQDVLLVAFRLSDKRSFCSTETTET